MKPVPTPAALFEHNRERLRHLLEPRSLVVVNANDVPPTAADGTLLLHQNPDLFYLTGTNQEETILVLAPDAFDPQHREVLFVREPSDHLAIWEGHKLSKAQATARSGIQTVKWLSEFPAVLHQLMVESRQVYLNTNEHPRAVIEVESRDARFIRHCQARYPLHDYRRLAPLMHELRTVKSKWEISLIREACAITRRGFRRALKAIRPGANEAAIEAAFAFEFTRSRAVFAYPPIIATGANNCILHYNQNDQTCRRGDLVLLDVAAGYGQYMSDLTRTVPVSGRFTRRQKDVYRAVLRVLRQITQFMRPGRTALELRRETERLLGEECVGLGLLKPGELKRQTPENPAVKPYFMHGVAHPLGLDVHDVVYAHQPIQPGWVLTCEPALYLRDEGFGIRLENDILVGDQENVDLMAEIPIEPEEIEDLMQR